MLRLHQEMLTNHDVSEVPARYNHASYSYRLWASRYNVSHKHTNTHHVHLCYCSHVYYR